MQIQLTPNGRIPSGVKSFYVVQGIRSGYTVTRWTDGAEANADCDARNRTASTMNRYHVVKLHF